MAKQMITKLSVTNSFKGSAFWMAPEVIRQRGHGVAADVWSVGCTVLEMASGQPPWSHCSTQARPLPAPCPPHAALGPRPVSAPCVRPLPLWVRALPLVPS